jgi:hypothetical protein
MFSVGHLLGGTRSNKATAKKSKSEGKNATARNPFNDTKLQKLVSTRTAEKKIWPILTLRRGVPHRLERPAA